MTHIALISLLNRHKKVIDQAYRGEVPSEIDEALFEAEIFNKIGDRIVLNEAYIQFVNTMLKRVEYGVIFGNYAQELQQLVSYKQRYHETGEKTYLGRMRKGVEDIYLKFKRRDSDISVLIAKIVHENRLGLEVILDDAEDILAQVKELSVASTQTYETFTTEIMGTEPSLDRLIVDVKIDIQRYSENLHKYIHRLNGFILRTRQRKEQNNKIASLTQKILEERAESLEALLRSSHSTMHHTIGALKRYKIRVVPAPKDMEHERFVEMVEGLLASYAPKPLKAPTTTYGEREVEQRVVLNYQRLLADVQREKPDDLFGFILSHREVKKFDEARAQMSEAFKAFLLIVAEQKEHTKIKEGFGPHHIRSVAWI